MSDVPPPPKYVAYPRGETGLLYGSADKLQALGEGYFGLNMAFFLNVLLAVGVTLLAQAGWIAYLLGVLAIFLLIAFLTYPYNRKIAFGKGWADGYAVLTSVLMGLNSALCCGIIGYVVMQQFASSEMKRYGLASGAFGIRKNVWRAMVEQRRNIEAMDPPGMGTSA